MEFFLPFAIPPTPHHISYQSKIMLIGSCFSEEIGARLHDRKFNIIQNPSGIVYHPLIISDMLMRCITVEFFTQADIFESNGVWHSWQHHSSFSGYSKDAVLEKINQNLKVAAEFLRSATHVILTPATAFAYYLKDHDRLVANCHKQPASIFSKKLSDSVEIVDAFAEALKRLKKLNPNISVMITISPVKHLRDGAVLNNLSKANLFRAVHLLKEQIDDLYYFPSFEIMNDELRDYRFYKNDMAHPNAIAVDYIFEKFCTATLERETFNIMLKVEEILKASAHRPALPETQAHKKFLTSQLNKIAALEKQYPFLDFKEEVLSFKR